jgi:hypothetical protein
MNRQLTIVRRRYRETPVTTGATFPHKLGLALEIQVDDLANPISDRLRKEALPVCRPPKRQQFA